MEIIREETRDQDNELVLRTMSITKGNKHLNMSLNGYNELVVSFKRDQKEGEKGGLIQDIFEVREEDGELYRAIDGTFASYSGNVYFDTHGGNLFISESFEDDYNRKIHNYDLFFIEDSAYADYEINCAFFDDSMENESMKYFLNRMFEDPCNVIHHEVFVEKPLRKKLVKTVEKTTQM